MKYKWIIGAGIYLEIAFNAWKQAYPEIIIEKIEVPQAQDYSFELGSLDNLDPREGTAFVAFDERFGNFKRVKLMQSALDRGFKLESFISPRSMLSSNIRIGPNTFIGDGVVIGHGSRIDYNSVLLSGTQIGSSVHIRSSCWLESGTIVGNSAQIGAHSILRSGAIIAGNVNIGRGCELGWPQRYDKDIDARTFFDPRYDSPIYVYG